MHHAPVISESTYNLTRAHKETLAPPFDEFKSETVRKLQTMFIGTINRNRYNTSSSQKMNSEPQL